MTQSKSILAISGSGRSGTTILSVLLSQDPAILNIGQSRDFWRAFQQDRPCTCGASLHNCLLWSKVVSEGFPNWTARDFEKVEKQMRAFMQDVDRTEDWSDPSFLELCSATHSEFIKAFRSFIIACYKVSNAHTLVDISKSPDIALAFRLANVSNVFVLNVVRDPRAVACSWAKKGLDKAALNSQIDAWKSRQVRLNSWTVEEDLLLKKLDYQTFVNNPEFEIKTILDWVGPNEIPIMKPQMTKEKTTEVSWVHQHLFPPANEKVLAEKKTSVTIRAPKSWRNSAYWLLHMRVLYRTYPSGLKYIFGI